jgi:MGT family glycosyltransferase
VSRVAVTGMPAAGHVTPTLPVVRELVRRGHDVRYYDDEQFRRPIEATGAEFRAHPPAVITAEDIGRATRSGGSVRVVTRLLRATESLMPFVLGELLRAEEPDALAYDSNAIWGRMAAASLGLPTISLMTTFLFSSRDFAVLTARELFHVTRLSLPDVPGVRMARRRLLRRFGREVFPPAPTLPMRGDLTIFPIPRELQPANALLDGSCHFVGPTIERATATGLDTGTVGSGPLDAERRAATDGATLLVLVSLGTLHTGNVTFFRTCFSALADLPARFVIAVGSHPDLARLGPPPANVLVRTTVPQVEVLRHAAAFVTHGGMNSVLEGLVCGVPLVVVPQQVEQLLIAQAVAARGAAIVLRHNVSARAVPADQLRAAVVRALDDGPMRSAATALSRSVRAGGGAGAAADAIEDLLKARGGAG